MMMKREYRGQRSVTAIADYIRQQKSNPIREVLSLEEINSLDVSLYAYKCMLIAIYKLENLCLLLSKLYSFSHLMKTV